MKRLFVIMVCGLLFPFVGYSQAMNLEKLSPAEREKKLFEIAIAAMKEYAPSYYKEDIEPILGPQGQSSWEEDKYFGKMVYTVKFPFDLGKAISDGKEGDNVYGGLVGILGENGKAISILPTGWRILFNIPDESDVPSGAHGSPHPVAKPTTVPGSRYIRVE